MKFSIFLKGITKKSFCHLNYQRLIHFDPKPEIQKYYKDYMYTDLTKNELESSYIAKKEKVNKITKGNAIKKFVQALEFKSQVNEVLNIILTEIANSDQNILKKLSEYYFKLSGKMIRPYLLLLISKYVYQCKYNKNDYNQSIEHNELVKPFAACVEVIHNASLLHDDIIDNSDLRRSEKTAHKTFGIKKTVLGANFILSKAAQLINELDVPHINEIHSGIVNYLSFGEYEQSVKVSDFSDLNKAFDSYMIKTYYKTASLLALSLRGVGLIYQLDENLQKDLYDLGTHLGLLFQLVDDLLDVSGSTETLKKPAMNDIKEGVINSYILFEMIEDKKGDVLMMAERKFKNEGDIDIMIKRLESGKGIVKTQNLAIDHLLAALYILDKPFFRDTDAKEILQQYFVYLINRTY